MTGGDDGGLDEVLGAVADGTRLEILRALWDEHTERTFTGHEPVTFSELREAVGIRDSGRFNYHLDQLRPHFVRNVDDGYALTDAGARVIGAAVSGVYTDTETELPSTALGTCFESSCEGTVQAQYERGKVTIECDTCDQRSTLTAPPILVGSHDPANDPDVIARYALTVIQKTVRGFCNVCNGPTVARIARDDAEDIDLDVPVKHVCQECGSTSTTSAMTIALDHPAVIATFHEAGIDYREGLFWQEGESFEWESRIESDDPVRVEVDIAVGDERLSVEMDENLDVIEYERG